MIFVRDKNSSTDTNLELNDTMDGEMQCQTSVFIKEDMFITSDSTKCDAEPGFELNHLELLGFEMLQVVISLFPTDYRKFFIFKF